MITLKDSVSPPSLVIACAAANVAEQLGLPMTITSGNDSTHKVGSFHYSNRALDLRTRHWTHDQLIDVVAALRQRLGPKYQVIIESDHLHVEQDGQQHPL